MTAARVAPLEGARPVVALMVIDGRTYRATGNLVEGLVMVAVVSLEPVRPAPFSRQADDIEEVLA